MDENFDTLRKGFQSFLDDHAKGQGFSERTDELFGEWLTKKAAELVYEDHEKVMSSSKMATHLSTLFKMCEDEETEKKFLNKMAKATGRDKCEESNIKDCAKILCNLDKKECDKIIHQLEDHVGYKKNDSDDKKDDLKEGWSTSGRGRVVVNNNGKKGVILATDGGDANVAPMVGNTPRFRSPTLWRKGEYKTTGDKVKVPDHAPGVKDDAKKAAETETED